LASLAQLRNSSAWLSPALVKRFSQPSLVDLLLQCQQRAALEALAEEETNFTASVADNLRKNGFCLLLVSRVLN